MIIEVISMNGCILEVCYCSDWVYRVSIITSVGRMLEFDNIYFDEQSALAEGKAIIKLISFSWQN